MFRFASHHDEKAKINLRKHNVSFDEAESVFYDVNSIKYFDDIHSELEERFILVGLSNQGRVLFVSYTLRDNLIRIISARKLTSREVEKYGY
ncbi:MAG: BrnT family toxin [bacterium]